MRVVQKPRKRREKPQGDNTAHLIALIENTKDLIWSVDLDHRLVTFNKAVADEIQKHCGVVAKPGMCPCDLLPVERAQLWPPLFQRALEHGPFRAEYTLQDGRVMELAFNPIQAGETIIGVSVFAKDTTERKLAEELLKASEKRFRTLLDGAPMAIGFSRNGLILYVNFKYVEMFGLKSREEAIGRPVLSQWASESRASIEQLLRRPAEESRGIAFDGVAERPDGSRFPMHGEATAITLPDGPAHFVFLSDVTQSKATEEALRESEARFRNYFDLPLVGFSIVHPEAPGIIANERLCEMLGYTSEELKGLSWQQITHPDDLESNSANFNRLVSGEIQRHCIEKRYIRKDGSTLWAEITLGCVRKPDGTVDHVCGYLQDMGKRKMAEKALQTKIRELQLLSEMNGALVTAENEPALLKEYCRIMVETGGYRLAWVGFAENVSGKPVIPVAHFGHEEGYLKIADISWEDGERGHGVTGTAIRTGTIQLAEDFATCEALAPWREEALKRGYRSSIALPFRHSDGSMASLTAYGAKPGAWPESERKLLEEIARDLGYGITTLRTRDARNRNQEDLRASLEQTIQVIAETVDQRDPYTAGHERRVADLCAHVARKLGLDEERVHGLRLAAIIHDLGKIGIPAEILSKPGRLTPIQYSLIQEHAQLGYDILKNVRFPWPIADMVLQHHERIDGSGYPQHLVGDAILLESRILAVADVVEAMATHRPYRAARGIDTALDEILRGRATLYDSAVVDACLRIFLEDGYTFPE